MTKEEFIRWEKETRDTIDVKRIYVDVAGDLVAGILLSQIVFWFLPTKTGNNKLRVIKDNIEYLAKNRKDWFSECRISARQYDRAIKILKKKKIVSVRDSLFRGLRTPLISLDFERLLELIETVESEL